MKQKILIYTAIAVGLVGTHAMAYTCTNSWVYEATYNGAGGCPIPNGGVDNIGQNCATMKYRCHTDENGKQQMVISCDTCKTGYSLVQKYYTNGSCTSVPYWTCVEQTASNPESDATTCTTSTCTNSTWTNYAIGYQMQIVRACGNSTTCKDVARIYRCASGYYGISSGGSSSMSGCSPCPDDGASIPGSNDKKTTCFIMSGTDEKGTFNFGGSRCFYSE